MWCLTGLLNQKGKDHTARTAQWLAGWSPGTGWLCGSCVRALDCLSLLHDRGRNYSRFEFSSTCSWKCVPQVASVVSDSLPPCGLWPTRLLCPCESPSKNTGVGCQALLQGVFPARELTRMSCVSSTAARLFTNRHFWDQKGALVLNKTVNTHVLKYPEKWY